MTAPLPSKPLKPEPTPNPWETPMDIPEPVGEPGPSPDLPPLRIADPGPEVPQPAFEPGTDQVQR